MSSVGEASLSGSLVDSESLTVPEVDGYHGTSLSPAAVIMGEGFKASSNEYDWLGDGVIFFKMHHTAPGNGLERIMELTEPW